MIRYNFCALPIYSTKKLWGRVGGVLDCSFGRQFTKVLVHKAGISCFILVTLSNIFALKHFAYVFWVTCVDCSSTKNHTREGGSIHVATA